MACKICYPINELMLNSILDEEDFLNIGILGLHESLERFEIARG